MPTKLSGQQYYWLEDMYNAVTQDGNLSAENLDADDPRRERFAAWGTTLGQLYQDLDEAEKISYYVYLRAQQYPHLGLSFGYIGNFERWGDDRSFRVFNKVAREKIYSNGRLVAYDWVRGREWHPLRLDEMLAYVSGPVFLEWIGCLNEQYQHNHDTGRDDLNVATYQREV